MRAGGREEKCVGRPRRAPETFLLVSSRIGRGVSITSPRTGPARRRRRRRRRPSRPSRGRRGYSRAGIRRRPPRAPRPVSSCTRRGRRRSPRGRSRRVMRRRHRRRPYRRRPRSSSSRRGCDETKRRRRRRVARTRRRARSHPSDAGVTSPQMSRAEVPRSTPAGPVSSFRPSVLSNTSTSSDTSLECSPPSASIASSSARDTAGALVAAPIRRLSAAPRRMRNVNSSQKNKSSQSVGRRRVW